MRGEYLCKFYVNGTYNEETVYALNNGAARKIIEARYSDNEFRWASLPQLERNSISRF